MKISTVLEQDFVSRVSSRATRSTTSEEELANAIILQAVKDYRAALRGKGCNHKSAKNTVKECEKFFRSEYFRILTKLDGEMLITKLQEEYRNERNSRTRNK